MAVDNLILYRLIGMVNHAEEESNDTIIAKAMIENREKLWEISLDQFARQYYVSQAGISRFIKKLGFDSYNEFREQFAVSKYIMGKHHETKPESFDRLAAETYDHLRTALEEIGQYHEEDFQNVIRKLKAYQTIYFIGSELSMAVLRLLQYKLFAQGKNVYNIQSLNYQSEMLEHCRQDVLVVAVSIDDRWLTQFSIDFIKKSQCHTMLWTVKSDSHLHDAFDEVMYFGKYIDENIGYHQLMQFEQILFHML